MTPRTKSTLSLSSQSSYSYQEDKDWKQFLKEREKWLSEQNIISNDISSKERQELDLKIQEKRLLQLQIREDDFTSLKAIRNRKSFIFNSKPPRKLTIPARKTPSYQITILRSNKTSLQNNDINKDKPFFKGKISDKKEFKVFNEKDVICNKSKTKIKKINSIEDDNDTDDEILDNALKSIFKDLKKIFGKKIKPSVVKKAYY